MLGLLLAATLASCESNENLAPIVVERNTLNYVVRDNFGLSYLAVALNRTGLEGRLTEPGPFTLLAPSDAAFQAAGFNTQVAVSEAASSLSGRTNYHILTGEHPFLDQPLGLNQPLETISGSAVYLSRVKKDVDTITTINGSRLIRADIRASNGLMQVIDRYLEPNTFEQVGEALSADSDLALFYHALKRSGILAELNSSETYTVFAPNNAAVRTYGYADVMAIETADPEVLKTWLSYHIAHERKFAQDYFLLAEEGSTSYIETMLDGRTVTVNLLRQANVPNSFTGINVRGLGSTANITPARRDILAGNGVIHVIGTVLR